MLKIERKEKEKNLFQCMNKKYKVKCKKEKGRNKKTFWYYFSEMLKIERQKKREKFRICFNT
jgi:hypothetical protein